MYAGFLAADHSMKRRKTTFITSDITNTEDAPASWYSALYDFNLHLAYKWINDAPTSELTECGSGKLDKNFVMPDALSLFLGSNFIYEGITIVNGVCFLFFLLFLSICCYQNNNRNNDD